MPDISVIICSYNQSGILRDAIESVANQTLPASEIIVCDDASSDDSEDLIRSLEIKYRGLVRSIIQERNVGVAANRNTGLKTATGEFVTWLDGDDVFLPRKLELEAALLCKREETKWVYSQVIEHRKKKDKRYLRYKWPRAGMIFHKVVAGLGKAPRNPLVERATVEKVGFFDEGLPLYEDFDFCLRLSQACLCAYQPQPAMEYRIHPAGLSAQNAQYHRMCLNRLHQKLMRYTQDMPDRDQKWIENRFLSGEKVVFFGLKTGGIPNRRSEAIRYLAWAVRHNPILLIRPKLYRTLARVVLPSYLKSFLNNLKELLFG